MQKQVVAASAQLPDGRLGEIETSVEDKLVLGLVIERETEVDALHANPVVGARRQRTIRVAVDRRT